MLLLLAHRREDGQLEVARDEARITRLGEGVGKTGVLSEAAIQRTCAVLSDYARIARDAGAALTPVATEGLRQASNPDAFLAPAEVALGQPVQMISGDEEARLSYLSVAREEPGLPTLRVLDIGGGSTELVVGEGDRIVSQVSHKVGSVKLTERHGEDIDAITEAARTALATQPVEPSPLLHGLAGTVTTAAALLLGLEAYDRDRVDNTRWPRGELESLRTTLGSEPIDQRTRRPCLPRGRADVIIAGLTILLATLDHCGAQTLVCRDRGLRYALV